MNKYRCSRCNKDFRNNWTLVRHSNRKYPCFIDNSGVVNNEGSNRCQSSVNLVSNRCPNSVQNDPNQSPTSLQINTNNSKNPMNCQYCNKFFTRTENCYRHMKHRCKKKKELDKQKELNNIDLEI